MDEALLREQFPELLTPVRWGLVEAVFAPSLTLPPPRPIGNVYVVPFVGNNPVVFRVADSRPEIPGGTLEPGEDYLSALRRELMEQPTNPAGGEQIAALYTMASLMLSAARITQRGHKP